MLSRRDALRLSSSGALSLLPFVRALAVQQTEPAPGNVVAPTAPSSPTGPLPKIHCGIRVRISSAFVTTDRPTQIWADEAILSGPIATGGHDILIVARQISFEQDALINTQGPLSEPSYPPGDRARDGVSAGEDGKKGDDGAHGAPAGNVLLVAQTITGVVRVNADGQKGGNAQSGGNGAKGSVGAPQPATCTVGNPGGPGGAPGHAGIPGKGGDAGSITLVVPEGTLGRVKPIMSADGGVPGAPGEHGKLGDGGSGGQGGKAARVCDP